LALPQFEYFAPQSLEELSRCLGEQAGRARILAGGTDLVILLRERLVRAEALIDIGAIAALRGIEPTPEGGLRIGAATRIREVQRSALVRERAFAMQQAAGDLGSTQIRDMATLGGNSCNGSPAADTPPALIALDATITLASLRGRRQIPLEGFVTGARKTLIAPDEFLESFHLPAPWPNSASRFAYAGLRDAMEIDIANCAVNVALEPVSRTIDRVRIVMGAVGPTQLRARRAEDFLIGKLPQAQVLAEAAQLCADETDPIDDMRSSAAYRREVIKPLVRRTLADAVGAIA